MSDRRLAVEKAIERIARSELVLERFVPYVRHVDHRTVALATGDVVRMWRVDGLCAEALDQLAVNRFGEGLNNGLKAMAHERVALWTHLVRLREKSPRRSPIRVTPFVDGLLGEYEGALAGERLYTNRRYVSLVVRPELKRELRQASISNLLKRASGSAVAVAPADLELLEDQALRLEELLRPYGVQPLALEERDGLLFSEVAEALRLILTGNEQPVGLVRGELGRSLLNLRPIFGAETVEIREAGERRFVGMLSIGDYPATTRLGMLDPLLAAPCQMVVTQSFCFLSRAKAREVFGRKQNQMASSGDKALTQAALLEEATDQLENNAFCTGRYHLSVAVIEEDLRRLPQSVTTVARLLSKAGITASREDLSLIKTWFAQLPGNFKHRVRVAESVTSWNFTQMSLLHSHATGRTESLHWSRPVAEFRTSALGRYSFNYHVRDVGHALILGATGAGKSVVLAFTLGGLMRLGASIVVFDKDRSTELFIGVNGGRYLSLRLGQETGAAPLKAMETYTDAYRSFLVRLVTRLVSGPGVVVSAEDRRRIEEGVRSVERLPWPLRGMQALRANLGGVDANAMGQRLERWCRGNELGWVLDSDEDRLSFENERSAQLIGFDLTELLRSDEAREPLLMYLFERLDRMADGRRLVWAVEEFHAALSDEAIRRQVDDALRTWRKRNAMAILVSQNPTDAINSPIGPTLIQQTATKVLLPNPWARLVDYVDRLNCLRREFELLATLGITSRKFLVKQSDPDVKDAIGSSVLCDLDLSHLEQYLRVLSPQAERGDFVLWDRVRAEVASSDELWDRFREAVERRR